MSNTIDVEMKNSSEVKNKNNTEISPIYQEYKKLIVSMEKASSIKDYKALNQLYKQITKFRYGFSKNDFSYILELFLNNTVRFSNLEALGSQTKDVLHYSFNFNSKYITKINQEVPEVFFFNVLLLVLTLIDDKLHQEAFEKLAFLIGKFKELKYNNQTLAHLKAKTYYYYCLEAERLKISSSIMKEVINSYRIACLDLDEETQVTLINCILRFYISNNSYEQARNFLSKSKYIENVSVYEDARYLYYLGRINCVHMNYSEAFSNLTNSLRKAPDNSHGFIATLEKLLMIVELLMGDIPDVSKYLKLPKIAPYVVLLRAVKKGNLVEFKETIEKFKNLFFEDKNYNLIQRLRLIVIKVGLRKINLSYSRISIKDISEKLNLGSEKETKLVIMKAIRDGVFVAKINNETGVVESENITDIYSTFDPQKAFYRRIQFLNNIHNETMKGIKYPDNKDKEKKTNTLNDGEEDLGFEGQVLDL